MTTHIIEFSFTSPPITANMRFGHWAQRSTLVKQIRREAAWKTRALRLKPTEHIEVRFHYAPRDNRRRDADNLVPTLKAICDGICDSGLVPDDTPAYMTKLMPIIHPHEKGDQPKCWIAITTDTEQETP